MPIVASETSQWESVLYGTSSYIATDRPNHREKQPNAEKQNEKERDVEREYAQNTGHHVDRVGRFGVRPGQIVQSIARYDKDDLRNDEVNDETAVKEVLQLVTENVYFALLGEY